MNVLVGISILLCIDLVGAGSTFTHLVVRVWLDHGKDCEQVNETTWSYQDNFVQKEFMKKDISTYEPHYLNCGCTTSNPICDTSTNNTQLTLCYTLTDTSSNLKPYKSFTFKINEVVDKTGPHFFMCASVTPSNPDITTCTPQKSSTSPSKQQQQQQQQQSDSNLGVILGPTLSLLALLAALGLAYPLYRYLQKRKQVDTDNDISPIVPANFGITDAPNSVAPAGT